MRGYRMYATRISAAAVPEVSGCRTSLPMAALVVVAREGGSWCCRFVDVLLLCGGADGGAFAGGFGDPVGGGVAGGVLDPGEQDAGG